MNILNIFVKESNAAGNRLEARLLSAEGGGGYKVQYYVNGNFKSETLFNENVSVYQAEKHAKDWLDEVRDLNG